VITYDPYIPYDTKREYYLMKKMKCGKEPGESTASNYKIPNQHSIRKSLRRASQSLRSSQVVAKLEDLFEGRYRASTGYFASNIFLEVANAPALS
jgi:hypothetical protein